MGLRTIHAPLGGSPHADQPLPPPRHDLVQLLRAYAALRVGWQLTDCWAAANSSAAVVMLTAPPDPEQRAVRGFAIASAMTSMAMPVAVRRTVAAAGAHAALGDD